MTSSPGQRATDVFAAEAEANQILLARAHRKTGRVPPEMVVRHVLSVTRGGDWPVQRDALEALITLGASNRAERDLSRGLRDPTSLLTRGWCSLLAYGLGGATQGVW